MKFNLLVILLLMIYGCISPATAQTTEPRATDFEISEVSNPTIGGKLSITVGGQRRKIADEALEAWFIDDGQQVVYSAADGAGGYENEGQSLRVYDVKTGAARKVMSEYVMVEALAPVKLTSGKTVLLVRMTDGGLGASYFAVVDPLRGQIFKRLWAELTALDGDRVTLAFYREEDWSEINEGREPVTDKTEVIPKKPRARPFKTEVHDLKKLLKNKVITNKPINLGDN
jgi:hypothetical protein